MNAAGWCMCTAWAAFVVSGASSRVRTLRTLNSGSCIDPPFTSLVAASMLVRARGIERARCRRFDVRRNFRACGAVVVA